MGLTRKKLYTNAKERGGRGGFGTSITTKVRANTPGTGVGRWAKTRKSRRAGKGKGLRIRSKNNWPVIGEKSIGPRTSGQVKKKEKVGLRGIGVQRSS